MNSFERSATTVIRGFSLVELSIVLVILGLLVGGILAGQSLIRASELRAVTTEYNRWITAGNAFRDKYFALPGDMTNATQFWGRQLVHTTCATNSGASVNTTTGVCDGDGNGQLSTNGSGRTAEAYQFWRILALAGLIDGTYDGTAGSGSSVHSIAGTNVPTSKVAKAGWSVLWRGSMASSSYYFDGPYANALQFGADHPTDASGNEILTPTDTWNIDKKMDDGMPGTGKVTVRVSGDQCAVDSGGVAVTSGTQTNSVYNLTYPSVTCALQFRQAF